MIQANPILIVTAIALTLTTAPLHAAETMSKGEIATALIGKTLTTSRKGIPVRLTYKADGSVAMKAIIISAKGTWRYSDTGLCMTMTGGPRKGETCVTFTNLGGGQYLNSQGMTLTVKN